MNKKELVKKLCQNISYSNKEPWENITYLLDTKKTTPKKIVFSAYDANSFPLPAFSSWNPKHRKKQSDFLLKSIYTCLGDELASKLEIQVDDTIIQD